MLALPVRDGLGGLVVERGIGQLPLDQRQRLRQFVDRQGRLFELALEIGRLRGRRAVAARVAAFPGIAATGLYLRACVTATAIDSARAQLVRERAYGKLEARPVVTPEDLVLDEIERDDLWRAALAAAATEQERVVLIESFRYELPPRDILARHPDLFDDIRAVYLAKRHLLGRLQRSWEMRRFHQA